jgi:hypothetical protein
MHTSFDDTLQTVRREMAGEPAETQIGYRLECIITELDEMMCLAVNPETVDLIEKNKIAIGQIMGRAQLIASFLMSNEPRRTVVSFRR